MDPYENARTVKVHVSAETMGSLLGIPPGAHVVAMRSDMDPVGVAVLVWSHDFPMKEALDAESPYATAAQVVVEHEVGQRPKIRYEWNWPSREARMQADLDALAQQGITGDDASTAYRAWRDGKTGADADRVTAILGEPLGRA